MKKFLVILMVIAMVSVLFVGCTTPPTPDPDPEPEPTPTPTVKTETPYITGIGSGRATVSLSSTSTQYTNSPDVVGVAVAGAIIKVYIDDVQSGVGSSGSTGEIPSIGTTMITLTEGVKVLHITATVPGLAESDPSTEYTFTYDETAPAIASMIADSSANTVTVTFDGPVETAASGTYFGYGALDPANYRWYNGLQAEAAMTTTTATISKTSDTVVVITPTKTTASNWPVQGTGTVCYITARGSTTNSTTTTIYDLAGNYNTLDSTCVSLSVP